MPPTVYANCPRAIWKPTDFRSQFNDWVDCNIAAVDGCARRVRGILFGIVERELGYSIEFTGTEEFDPVGDAWTWSECWDSAAKDLPVTGLALTYGAENLCDLVKSQLLDYLSNGFYSRKLRSFEGVGVCDLEMRTEVLWIGKCRLTTRAMRRRRALALAS